MNVRAAPARAGFHWLRVAAVDRLCEDAVAIRFDVPPELSDRFAHRAGQNLTLRRVLDGRDERRSYSICSAPDDGLRIGVRSLPGGAVSSWLVDGLRPGDEIEVSRPTGGFVPRLDRPARHVMIGAGSGITPLLAISSAVLAAHEKSSVALIYGNRRANSIMFVEEISDLKDAYPERFEVIHVLSREAQEVELFGGRIDENKLRMLLPLVTGDRPADEWWLCGPHGMVTAAVDLLRSDGVADETIHRELFWVEPEPPEQRRRIDAPPGKGSHVTVLLDGRTTEVTVPAGETILEAAQRLRPDLPFACKGGVCGTCRAMVVDGEVEMRRNFALEPGEQAAGYVLTCQAECLTERVTVSFDA